MARDDSSVDISRRQFLVGVGSAATVGATAGCQEGGSTENPGTAPDQNGTETGDNSQDNDSSNGDGSEGFSPEFGSLGFENEYVRGDTVFFDETSSLVTGEDVANSQLVLEYDEEGTDTVDLTGDVEFSLNSAGSVEAYLRAESNDGETVTSEPVQFDVNNVNIDAILEGEDQVTLEEDQRESATINYSVESNVDSEEVAAEAQLLENGEEVEEAEGVQNQEGSIIVDYDQLIESSGPGEYQVQISVGARGEQDTETVNLTVNPAGLPVNAELDAEGPIMFGEGGEIAEEIGYSLELQTDEEIELEAAFHLEDGDFSRQVYEISELEGSQLVNFRDLAEATPNQEGTYNLVLRAEPQGERYEDTAEDGIETEIVYDEAETFLQQLDMFPNNPEVVDMDRIRLNDVEHMANQFPEKIKQNFENAIDIIHNDQVDATDIKTYPTQKGPGIENVDIMNYLNDLNFDVESAMKEGRETISDYRGRDIIDIPRSNTPNRLFYDENNHTGFMVHPDNVEPFVDRLEGDVEGLRGEFGLQYEDENGVKRANSIFDMDKKIVTVAGSASNVSHMFTDYAQFPFEMDFMVQMWDEDEDYGVYESAVFVDQGDYDLEGNSDLATVPDDSKYGAEEVFKMFAARDFNGT